MTDIVLFDFLLLLLVYFILHYHLIFREGIFFFFFERLYFSEYDIQMLLQTYQLNSGSSNSKEQHKVLC